MDAIRNADESATEFSIIVTYEHINGAGRLFGGRLAEWIDVVGGITAKRHCRSEVTTAAMDVDYTGAAGVNDIITVKGRAVYTGNTSLVVRVEAFKEDFSGVKVQIARAHLTFVALGLDAKPMPVPKLEILTEQDRAAAEICSELARIKKEMRKKEKGG